MRNAATAVLITLTCAAGIESAADLQEVSVGGSIRIRGNWYSERAGATGLTFTDGVPDDLFIEQRTRVNVDAQFTEGVSAFIELDSYNNFGEDFRGLTGIDTDFDGVPDTGVPLGVDNSDGTGVSLYQGYIDISEMWGSKISLRIGRQEILRGSEFLVGNNDTSSLYRGLSFDGVTLRSKWGDFELQSFYTEPVYNNNPLFFEDSSDVYFHGIYLAYTGFEDMTIDAYAMRYYQALTTPLVALGYVEEADFTTVGVRFAGARSQFDWDVEGAYQFGDSGLAAPLNEVSAFAATAKAGYTFDVKYQPRVFLNGTYLSGDDDHPAFNRLFSDHEYSEFLDGTDLTNVWIIGGGASAQVTESIGLTAAANYYNAVEDFGTPDSALGVEVALYATYQYSEDLGFSAGYAHFFAGDGLQTGQLVTMNGFGAVGGFGPASDEGLHYVFFETSIEF